MKWEEMQFKVQICRRTLYATSKCGILTLGVGVGSSKNWAFCYLLSLIPLNNSIKMRY